MAKKVKVGNYCLGQGGPLFLIAGPCVIESEVQVLNCARRLADICRRLKLHLIFKASYDKANRTSLDSYRGPGLVEGLRILRKVKRLLRIPVLSDVHCRTELDMASEVLDVIQIPAFLCRQTDFIIKAARTGRALNIKKGQFLAPWDVRHIIKKIENTGKRNILITERGTCFGYNNLVSDMRSLPILRKFGYPVVFDATHSVQLPGAKVTCSGGEREYVLPLARAAVAAGCDGIFLEVHENPKRALCDGANMLDLKSLAGMLKTLKAIDSLVGRGK